MAGNFLYPHKIVLAHNIVVGQRLLISLSPDCSKTSDISMVAI
jgi:hypothetical protein